MLGNGAGFTVLKFHHRGHRHDLLIKPARFLRGMGTLLRLQRVVVLHLAADAIARRDGFGCFQHRHVNIGFVLL